MQVEIIEAGYRLSALVRSARRGETVLIAERGHPVARLVPVGARSAPTPAPEMSGNIVDWLERNPLPNWARRTDQEIEVALRKEHAAWD